METQVQAKGQGGLLTLHPCQPIHSPGQTQQTGSSPPGRSSPECTFAGTEAPEADEMGQNFMCPGLSLSLTSQESATLLPPEE